MALPLLVASLFGLSVVGALLGQWWGRRAGWVISVGLTVAAGIVGWLALNQPGLAWSVSWIPQLGVHLSLRLDGLAVLFALVVLVIGALVMAYSVNYLKEGAHGRFYGQLTAFAAAMTGLVLADDLLVLWVMWEFTTICSFLLIAQSGAKGVQPAVRTFVLTASGGLCLLGSVALARVATGSLALSDVLNREAWQGHPTLLLVSALLVAVSAFTKCAQFPFHFWLPDAMVASTPVSAYLHAAAMVKAGIFLLVRFSTLFAGIALWDTLLLVTGLVTALFGATMAMQRYDMKELLAYSTVSQLGFLVATIGIGSNYAIIGALTHVLAHALFKSALFMGVGVIDHQTGTRDIRTLRGLARSMPVTSTALVVAAAGMAGLPPLFGFVSKEALFGAMTRMPVALAVPVSVGAVLAATLTFAYCGRMLVHTLPGERMDNAPQEGPALMLVPVVLASFAGIVFGLFGPLLQPLVDAAASEVTGHAEHSHLNLWHGLNWALGMSAAVILLGTLAVVARRQLDPVLARLVPPVPAVRMVDDVRSVLVGLAYRLGGPTRTDSPARHLGAGVAALVVLVFASLVNSGLFPMPDDAERPYDWFVAVLVWVGVGFTIMGRSRVALVTTVGIVGFSVALMLFQLGAPDVALTQLLVEILTVVMMVLLLGRLPRAFHATGRKRITLAAALGVLAGITGFVLAWNLQADARVSDIGKWYLTNAEALTGGSNVVNTILVDFRALDTFGELCVLGVTAMAILVALESRGLLPMRSHLYTADMSHPAMDPADNNMTLQVVSRIVGPVLLVMTLWLYFRGHHAPGGGFIAALVMGSALCLVYLAYGRTAKVLDIPSMLLVSIGVLVSVGAGLLGYTKGSFLTPIKWHLGPLEISSVLVFDLGVFLAVTGLMLSSLARLGEAGSRTPPIRVPGPVRTRTGGSYIHIKGGED
ncbi:hydrogen gas-evolving membrane-bound hydrogenase subunit E [Luteococcus sp. Sow4_B9]|uniref:hydrogen gas-evolving membrane-bound hydrogenase subunit E n=1 Tax=Luteococcus sp. Sow4_B9 TaxID=3438792 RepID=UPI003F95EC4C